MLPPVLKHGSPPHTLILCHRSLLVVRASQSTSTLQTRTFFGRRHRNELRRHADQKRLRNYNYNDESDYGRNIKHNPSAQSYSDFNDKEQMWQQRMDHIRKALEQDPYEALFGNSNRMLGRFGKRAWPMEISSLWRNQAERDTTWRKQMSSWRIEILGDKPSQGDGITPDPINSTAPTTVGRTESNSKHTPIATSPIGAGSQRKDEDIEYDPISNRMIHKTETIFGRYGQDVDAPVDIPVKPFKPAETADMSSSESKPTNSVVQRGTNILQTSLDRYATTPKVAKQSDGKPLQTSLDRYTKETSKDRQPSFTMLKEDPIENQQPYTQSDAGKSKMDETAPTDVRAEYDQYKAARLPPANFSRDDWLIQEGFVKSSPAKTSDSSEGKDTKKRIMLENDFNEVHSIDKEVAEKTLQKLREVQNSKSNEVSVKEQESAKTMSQWLGDEWTMEKLRQQELDALNPQAPNTINLNEVETIQEYTEPGTHHVKLAPTTESTKAEEMAAMNEVMDYNKQVARSNLKNKEANAKKEMENNRVRMSEAGAVAKTNDYQVAEMREKTDFISKMMKEVASDTIEPSTRNVKLAQESESKKAEEAAAMNDIMDYNIAVAKNNMKNKVANAKKELVNNRASMAETLAQARAGVEVIRHKTQVARDSKTVDYRARIAEAIEEARAHAEILDVNFSKMKDKIQILIQKLEETRKAKYQAQSMQKQVKEIQLAGAELAKLVSEFKAKLATERSRISEGVSAKSESAEKSALVPVTRRIPSLTKFFGYTTKKAADAALVRPIEDSKLTKAQASLETEIAAQKAAMNALETSRTAAASLTANNISASAWPVSDRTESTKKVDENDSLTRRIRSIYESKYGKIATNHAQPLVDSCNPNLIIAPPVEPEVETSVPEVASAPMETSGITPATEPALVTAGAPEVVPAAPPKATPTAVVPEPATEPAANVEAEIPIDTPAVPYTLLAYDSQTQSITRASFTSPPQSSESTIPLTLALRELHHPAKFLPLVQELRLKGYETVHGERNMLILRQMQGSKRGASEAFVVETVAAKDEPKPRLPSWGATSGPRRTEEVFSGTQAQRGNKKDRKQRKKAWGRAMRRVALGVAAVGGTIYVAGVMAEMTKIVVS